MLCLVAVLLLASRVSGAASRQHGRRRSTNSNTDSSGDGEDDRPSQTPEGDDKGDDDDGDAVSESSGTSSSSRRRSSRQASGTTTSYSSSPSEAPTIQRLREKVPSSVSLGTLPRVGAVLMHVLPEPPGAGSSSGATSTGTTTSGSEVTRDPVQIYRPQHPYPWGGSLEERSSKILAQMRSDLRMSIDGDLLPEFLDHEQQQQQQQEEGVAGDIVKGTLPSESESAPLFITPRLLSVSDAMGVPFGCGLRESLHQAQTDAGTRSSSSIGRFRSATSETDVPMHQLDSELLSRHLAGQCSTLHLDYWTYEWCHRSAVSQYHINIGQRTSRKDPDWSLGRFVGAELQREGGLASNLSAPISRLTERFEGGQRCDETNGHRSSEVHKYIL